jgi:hypothetical protein
MIKRFVRDHGRYIDDIIMCGGPDCPGGTRTFANARQQCEMASTIAFIFVAVTFNTRRLASRRAKLEVAKDPIPKGAMVCMWGRTNERKKNLQVIRNYWDVVFLDNHVVDLVKYINNNNYGMIDHLVTSRGRTFWMLVHGAPLQEIYCTNTRISHSQNEESEGYEIGLLSSTSLYKYYAIKNRKNKLLDYWPIKKVFLQENFQRRGGIWILHCIALHFIDGMLASLFA